MSKKYSASKPQQKSKRKQGVLRPLYITEGDPSGISPEIFNQEIQFLRKLAKSRPIFYFRAPTNLKYSAFDITLSSNAYPTLQDTKLNFPKSGLYEVITKLPNTLNLSKLKITAGKPSELTGLASYLSLFASMNWIKNFPGDLITLPLSKEWVIRSGNKKFQGHTEDLAKFFNKPTFMLMAGENWNVIPLTTHVPLRDVAKKLKKVLWNDLFASLVSSRLFGKNPKIGILGLNPHAGEGGKIGNEESTILMKNLESWKEQGAKLFGPLSADSTFAFGKKSAYDVILACYHDQGLIPFKMLEGKNGVNITLGLDFLRVSPDHGPAYDIAGKGIADSTSFKKCLEWCDK